MMTNEQQRIKHLEKLLDDATGAMALLRKDNDSKAAQISALLAENVGLINSSVNTLQDGRPSHGFYASEWFIAKLKNGEYAALKALPEEYSYDYRTNDGTYYTKDWVVGWMQTPDTEYRPNVETPATDAAIAAIRAEGVEMFANFWESNCRHNDTFVGGEANRFAAKLREGAQK